MDGFPREPVLPESDRTKTRNGQFNECCDGHATDEWNVLYAGLAGGRSMKDRLHVFPDTNVFLHYPPLSQIDWRKHCDADSVHLLVCLEVIHELDTKKSDSRLAARADRAIKEIRETYHAGTPIRDNVTLSIFNQELRHSDFPTTLSPDSGDDKIVHLARMYREQNPENEIAIVTEDLGMELRCQAGGVAAVRMDSAIRLENPQDDMSRKYRQAIQELAAAKNRQPKLKLWITHPGETVSENRPPMFELNDLWQPPDIEAELAELRRKYPKQAGLHAQHKASSEVQGFAAVAQMIDMGHRVSPKQWEAYDEDLEAYFEKYRKYLEGRNELEQIKARCISFGLVLRNDGNGLATDIDVAVSFPLAIHWVSKSGTKEARWIETPLSAPEPPKMPKPASLVDVSISDMVAHAVLAHRNDALDIDIRPRDEFTPYTKVVKAASGDWEIRSRLSKLKHGHDVALGTFVTGFASWDVAKPLSAHCFISTCELTNKTEDALPIIVGRASQRNVANGEQ
jgi:hypothetical protein